MVKFVWISLLVMLLGVVVSFSHRSNRRDEDMKSTKNEDNINDLLKNLIEEMSAKSNRNRT
jgi:cell shape-determining protein MreC